MKGFKFEILLFCTFFVLPQISVGQVEPRQLSFISGNMDNIQLQHKPNLQLSNSDKEESRVNTTVNRIIIVSSALLGITGTIYQTKSHNTYNSYKNYKNDVVYNASNTFTPSDLQKAENERVRLFDQANKEKKLSNYIIGAGLVIFGIHVCYKFPERKPLKWIYFD